MDLNKNKNGNLTLHTRSQLIFSTLIRQGEKETDKLRPRRVTGCPFCPGFIHFGRQQASSFGHLSGLPSCLFLVEDPCFPFHWLFDSQAAPVNCFLPGALLAFSDCVSSAFLTMIFDFNVCSLPPCNQPQRLWKPSSLSLCQPGQLCAASDHERKIRFPAREQWSLWMMMPMNTLLENAIQIVESDNHHKFLTIFSHYQPGDIDQTNIVKVDLWTPLTF